jgi:hypothetical protein
LNQVDAILDVDKAPIFISLLYHTYDTRSTYIVYLHLFMIIYMISLSILAYVVPSY